MAEQSADQILQLIRAFRPGEDVTIIPAGEGQEEVTLRVRDIPLKDMRQFASSLARVIPSIIDVVSGILKSELEGGDVTVGKLKADPHLVEQVLKRPATIGQLVPIFVDKLFDLINACVEPEGVFPELPHDLAAPVVAKWFELNVLAEGKLGNWMKAFEGVASAVDRLLPTSESSSPPSSPTASAPTSSGASA